MDLTVSLDSGAYSLYNKEFARSKGVTSYEYYKSPTFKKYVEDYIEFLHRHKDSFSFYVNLDIIFNPKLTWEMQKYFESNGLNPLPVFHFGADFKWLKKYMDSYDYIGIGGVADIRNSKAVVQFLNKVYSYILDKNNKPRIKIHGFGITSLGLLKKYPWYTADSSTWGVMSRTGSIMLPKVIYESGKVLRYEYLTTSSVIPITPRTTHRPEHLVRRGKGFQDLLSEYLEQFGMTIEEVGDTYDLRSIINLWFFRHVQDELKQWYKERFDFEEGGNVYVAGNPPCSGGNLNDLLLILRGLDKVNYLSSYFDKKFSKNLLGARKFFNEEVVNAKG